jgi:CRISPR-associated endoribonuclease Cas6
MRVKITFSNLDKKGTIPIHHQPLLFELINGLTKGTPAENKPVCFSTLKGIASVSQEHIRFRSARVSLVITSPHEDVIHTILLKLFGQSSVKLHTLSLLPQSYRVMAQPKFETKTKYICISPYIPYYQKGIDIREATNPNSHEFSDRAFEFQILRMERAGYPEELLHAFSEFEIFPDLEYFKKVENSSNALPRLYKTNQGETVFGYLFPFTAHAHPEFQKFIWENGIGQYTSEGYGMLDTVPQVESITDEIVP